MSKNQSRKSVWYYLSEPSPAITDPEARRRARLFSLLVLPLLVGLVPAIMGTPIILDHMKTNVAFVMLFAVMLVSYGLSRTRFWVWGVALTLTAMIAMPYLVGLAAPKYLSSDIDINFMWMILPLLLSSIVFPKERATLIVVIGVLLLLAAPLFIAGLTFRLIFSVWIFIAAWATLHIIFLHHMDDLEAIRQQNLQNSTRELADANAALSAEVKKRRASDEALRVNSQELMRTNAFIEALNKVAAAITAKSDLDQILETLGNELKKLEIDIFVALQTDPEASHFTGQYVSIRSKTVTFMEKMAGVTLKTIPIWYDRGPLNKVVATRQGQVIPDPTSNAHIWVPNIPEIILKKLLALVGIHPDSVVFYLPLVVGEQVLGVMAVWGDKMREKDLAPLSVFANQVAGVIENGRLFAQAQQEIADRERVESELKASLKEKELLLQEVHHRVKNNMQIISSLLNLQIDGVQDEQAVAVLKDSQHRVRSMAMVHEKLYQSKNFAQIDFAEYVRQLATYLFRSHGARAACIDLVVEADEILLTVDSAVPCGLILNELISNALKHAFPDGRSGQVCVRLFFTGNELNLVVSDNGVGMADGFDIHTSSSLGMQLVDTLANQLDGPCGLPAGNQPARNSELNLCRVCSPAHAGDNCDRQTVQFCGGQIQRPKNSRRGY
ncbi:MAG: hypothetical protein D6768_02515 [Chloroflexi bacterium]|nr:MAG: hypothetical protein D6768_02515 [Chloroflexota bacterium]